MSTRLWIALVLGIAIAAPARPLRAADPEQQQIMADIRMLQEQTQQLQLLLTNLTQALTAVTTRLDAQVEVNRKAFADQKLMVDNLSGDLRIVREKIDDTNVRIASLSQEVEALRLAIPAGGPMSMSGAPPDAGPVETVPGAPVAPGTSPQRLYDTAWADYAAGQWALAISGFETYINTFPQSESADEAQTYIGASYLLDGKYKEAVAAFDKVIANFPNSNSVAEAYYKRGLALERLGEAAEARSSYETVMKQFPETQSSRLAAQALDRLQRAPR